MTREEAIYYVQSSGFSEEQIRTIEQAFTCEDAISRQAVLKTLDDIDNVLDEDRTIENYKELLKECYEVLPSVNPQVKTGHWIEIAKYSDGRHEIECSECGSHIFDRGHANSYVVKEKYKYCPRCGFRMIEPQESEG